MIGKNVCSTTLPGAAPRPARPATCVSNWNVRSAARKSGKLRAASAPTTPTSVTFVHVVSLGNHLRAHQQVDFAACMDWLSTRSKSSRPRTVSRSSRAMRACGNMRVQTMLQLSLIPCPDTARTRCRTVGQAWAQRAEAAVMADQAVRAL